MYYLILLSILSGITTILALLTILLNKNSVRNTFEGINIPFYFHILSYIQIGLFFYLSIIFLIICYQGDTNTWLFSSDIWHDSIMLTGGGKAITGTNYFIVIFLSLVGTKSSLLLLSSYNKNM